MEDPAVPRRKVLRFIHASFCMEDRKTTTPSWAI
jgi:hypothetical protein